MIIYFANPILQEINGANRTRRIDYRERRWTCHARLARLCWWICHARLVSKKCMWNCHVRLARLCRWICYVKLAKLWLDLLH